MWHILYADLGGAYKAIIIRTAHNSYPPQERAESVALACLWPLANNAFFLPHSSLGLSF